MKLFFLAGLTLYLVLTCNHKPPTPNCLKQSDKDLMTRTIKELKL